MRLAIHAPGAEPYDLDAYDLTTAIETEARTIAEDAGSELLAADTTDERDELAARVVREATGALRGAGDSYTDPTGVRWTLDTDR
jgi:hypothetical protein